MKIGWIGLGIMGKPMAKNLLKAGYELWVNNRSQGPMEELAACGAHAATRKELAENAIDAGAKHVTVEIQNGGMTFLRVTDDALPRQTVDGRNIGNLQRRLAAQLRHALISHAVAYNDQILHKVL